MIIAKNGKGVGKTIATFLLSQTNSISGCLFSWFVDYYNISAAMKPFPIVS
jgi:hypothetical protein